MSLTLHYHPLSSYCWKALIALYENDTPFTPHLVNFGDAAAHAALLKLWPVGKFPVLQDDARGAVIPETTVIIEYLDRHYPGRVRFIPDGDPGLQTRLRDRFFDLHVHDHIQAIIGNRLRPRDQVDPFGVDAAKAKLRTAWDIIERDMTRHQWAMGDAFTLADCAALPPLFYGNKVVPFVETHKNVAAYLERLLARRSVARVIAQATPYFHMVPQEATT